MQRWCWYQPLLRRCQECRPPSVDKFTTRIPIVSSAATGSKRVMQENLCTRFIQMLDSEHRVLFFSLWQLSLLLRCVHLCSFEGLLSDSTSTVLHPYSLPGTTLLPVHSHDRPTLLPALTLSLAWLASGSSGLPPPPTLALLLSIVVSKCLTRAEVSAASGITIIFGHTFLLCMCLSSFFKKSTLLSV